MAVNMILREEHGRHNDPLGNVVLRVSLEHAGYIAHKDLDSGASELERLQALEICVDEIRRAILTAEGL